ncbi:MAG: transcription elongation factor GreA [Elusimicrobia bacterium RIFOXYA2_FULL_39_19]|nr:MAG: transcription elongation factor GreA [Elusimicrobia bacterium RIFOXYA2_FULL_39_19]
MAGSELFLTKEGHKKLTDELERRRKITRKDLSKAIGEAIEQGDLRENAGYHAAKEEQGKNEARISEIELKLGKARIIDEENININEAYVGSVVHLKDMDHGDEEKYRLLSGSEADHTKGEISYESPVGRALLGKKVGDIIEIQVPAGKLRYKLMKISK